MEKLDKATATYVIKVWQPMIVFAFQPTTLLRTLSSISSNDLFLLL
jgi:hypothetical protein